jgi:hypothetical protein
MILSLFLLKDCPRLRFLYLNELENMLFLDPKFGKKWGGWRVELIMILPLSAL